MKGTGSGSRSVKVFDTLRSLLLSQESEFHVDGRMELIYLGDERIILEWNLDEETENLKKVEREYNGKI